MTFILKAVAILFLFAFVVYVLKAITRLSANVRKTAKELNKMREQTQEQAKMRQPGNTEMIRCAACGAFVSPRDAVQVSSGGRAQRFCSYECLQTHAKTA